MSVILELLKSKQEVIVIQKEMEEFMKMQKLITKLLIIIAITSFIGLFLSILCLRNTDHIIDEIYTQNQNQIIDTYDMTSNSNIDPKNLENNVALSLTYCKNPDIVEHNGINVSSDCEYIRLYSEANYS